MAQSQNTKVEFTIKATSMHGLTTYGDVMLGDVAFEFYNDKNPEDYIQIPWKEIDHVAAEVLPGKKISRFAIFTKENGHYTFSTRDNTATLRAVREGRAAGIWHMFNDSPAHIALIEYLAKSFHPDLFADVDPDATMAQINARFSPVTVPGIWWVTPAR